MGITRRVYHPEGHGSTSSRELGGTRKNANKSATLSKQEESLLADSQLRGSRSLQTELDKRRLTTVDTSRTMLCTIRGGF